MTIIPGLFFVCSEKVAYSFSVIGTTSRPDFVSPGGPVEKVIWPARAANAVNRIRDKKNFVFGLTCRGRLFPLEVPISQPGGSINWSMQDVKDARKPISLSKKSA